MNLTYDFFVGEVTPAQPYPHAEQFQDTVDLLAPKDPKITILDMNRVLDPSFVQGAVDRGLAAPG